MTAGAAVVTGGSRGIGAATARRLAAAGYVVVFSYRAATEAAAAVVAAIEDAGGRAHAVRADAMAEDALDALFDAVDEVGEPLRALVNNAATTGPFGRFADLDAETLRGVVATNITGTMLCTQRAIARMATGRGGSGGAIVNVSPAQHGTGHRVRASVTARPRARSKR